MRNDRSQVILWKKFRSNLQPIENISNLGISRMRPIFELTKVTLYVSAEAGWPLSGFFLM